LSFSGYEPYKGDFNKKTKGVLIALERGITVPFAIFNLQPRGTIFLDPGVAVYPGMIIGEHSKDNDIIVNICKTKKHSNMRSSGADEAVKIVPARKFTLELALEYIENDELLEITPQNIRMRKKLLDVHERKRSEKQDTVV